MVYLYSTIKMMHGPINIREFYLTEICSIPDALNSLTRLDSRTATRLTSVPYTNWTFVPFNSIRKPKTRSMEMTAASNTQLHLFKNFCEFLSRRLTGNLTLRPVLTFSSSVYTPWTTLLWPCGNRVSVIRMLTVSWCWQGPEFLALRWSQLESCLKNRRMSTFWYNLVHKDITKVYYAVEWVILDI